MCIRDRATGLPFAGGKRVVDADRMQDIIDEVRLNLPTEVRQAKAIVNDRAEIVADAKREAEAIVKKAEDLSLIHISPPFAAQLSALFHKMRPFFLFNAS